MALPSASDIRTYGMPQITGTGEDTLLSGLIAAADQQLAQWCLYPQPDSSGTPLTHTLESATYVLYLDGPSQFDARRLPLGIRPIGSISSVAMDEADDGTYSTSVSSTQYRLDKHRGELVLLGSASTSWLTGYGAIKVTLTAGSDTGATPVLRQAIALQVAHLAMARRHGATMQTVSTAGSSTTYTADAIAPVVKQLLSGYYLHERARV